MSRVRAGEGWFPVVLAGPSGCGKTTVARALETRREDIEFSVSVTTRQAREGERHGIDYRFLEREEFEELIRTGGLLEWAEVHGKLYGTPLANLEAARGGGRHLLLDIDVQGRTDLTSIEPGTVSVFLLPPGAECVIRRLRARRTEDEEGLKRRLRAAKAELEAVSEFDYVLVNDDLEDTVSAVEAIIIAERARISRKTASASEFAERLARDLERLLETSLAE